MADALRKKSKKKIREVSFQFCNILFFAIFSLICIYPFYYIVINSITSNEIVLAGGVRLFPKRVHFKNYSEVFQMNGIFRATVISILRTVLGSCAMLISSTILGYIMSKPECWHRKFWYRFLIVTMYFGAGMIPVYINIKRLGLMDSFWVYVIPAFVSPYNMILIKTYIESIPPSLEEAAIVDGGGYFIRFMKIVIPLCKPILATVTVFTAVGQWNSFMDTILYMRGSDNNTLQSLLYQYLKQSNKLAELMSSGGSAAMEVAKDYAANPTTVRHTMTVVATLPVLLIYPFFQKYFTKGIMIGAVKG